MDVWGKASFVRILTISVVEIRAEKIFFLLGTWETGEKIFLGWNYCVPVVQAKSFYTRAFNLWV